MAYLAHYGRKGMKWGVKNFNNYDRKNQRQAPQQTVFKRDPAPAKKSNDVVYPKHGSSISRVSSVGKSSIENGNLSGYANTPVKDIPPAKPSVKDFIKIVETEDGGKITIRDESAYKKALQNYYRSKR